MRTAAQILVDQLVVHGVDTAYCVPGESYLGVLDGLGQARVALYTTRHEAAAANMAEAHGKHAGPGLLLPGGDPPRPPRWARAGPAGVVQAPTRGGPGEHGRGLRQAHGPA